MGQFGNLIAHVDFAAAATLGTNKRCAPRRKAINT
jgi:hypothetical protein